MTLILACGVCEGTTKTLIQRVSLKDLFHHAVIKYESSRHPQIAQVQDEGSVVRGSKFLGVSRKGEIRSDQENQESLNGVRP